MGDDDAGPNTGGMGAYSPLPWAPDGLVDEILADVLQPTVDEMARRGTPFSGLLYAGLALTSKGLRVIEFNARFGDPETQVVLPRLRTPLGGLLRAAATGRLHEAGPLEWSDDAAVTVVVAAHGLPRVAADRRRGVRPGRGGVGARRHRAARRHRPRRVRPGHQQRRPGAVGGRHRGRPGSCAFLGVRRGRPDRPARQPPPHRHRRRRPSTATDEWRDLAVPAGSRPERATRRVRENRRRDDPRRARRALRERGADPHLVAGAQGGAGAPALAGRARRAARPRGRRARRRRRGVREGRRRRRPRLDPAPRGGHPARREGPDRGVLGAGRARARAQGDDQPRPHRERRAAADQVVARAAAGPSGRRAGPAGPAGDRAQRPGDGRAVAQRGGAGDHPRQAVRVGGRGAAGRGRAARGADRALPAARHQGTGRHRAGPARPARR